MKTTLTRIVATAALACGALAAQAATVAVGSMSRDTSTALISDSLNGREWLGWDATRGYSYAQALAATGSGGVFEGFHIAGNADAQMFANALLGANGCTASNTATCKTGISAAVGAVTGESYYDYHSFGSAYDLDYVFFLSDNGVGQEVGLMESYIDDSAPTSNQIYKTNEWSTISAADYYTFSCPTCQIGWLLYRDEVTAVPEPGSVALVGAALLGAAGLRRRRIA